MKLYVGTDSTWSLRTLICFDIAQVNPEICVFNLGNEESRKKLKEISPTGLVPFLKDKDLTINDSLSIAEYLNELKEDSVYPEDPTLRALSRNLCAEMHSGFLAVRQQMPFSSSPNVEVVSPSSQVQSELLRIEAIFSNAKTDFFWGDYPTAVDAFYSAMAFRLKLYDINFTGNAGRYQRTLVNWDLFQNALKKIS